jgi:hypothetical protein
MYFTTERAETAEEYEEMTIKGREKYCFTKLILSSLRAELRVLRVLRGESYCRQGAA